MSGTKPMEENFSAAEIADMRSSFDLIDKDGNGFISKEEIRGFVELFGENPTDLELDAILAEVDKDGDGKFGLYDFATACRDLNVLNFNLETEEKLEYLRKALQMACISKTDYITVADLGYLFKSLGVKVSVDDLNELMSGVDTNSDGKIILEEFVNCLKSDD